MAKVSFYSMIGSHGKKWATASADEGTDRLGLLQLLQRPDCREQWPEVRLTSRERTLPDLIGTDVLGRVCSQALVSVLSEFDRTIWWLPIWVAHSERAFAYSYLRVTSFPDVIDDKKTIFAASRIAVPHVSLAKASSIPIFCLSHLGAIVYVRNDVKAAVEAGGCKGVAFERVSSS